MRAVLTYHAIDHANSVVSLTPELFAAHVAWLAGGTVRVVALTELLALPDDADAVALTFDDALASVATEAAPRLAAYGLPATVFAVTDHVGKDNRWGGRVSARVPVQPVLDWPALGRLAEAGWQIGAHTRRHPHLTRCSAIELEDELAGSAAAITGELGRHPVAMAYPYGECNESVVAAAAEHYSIACTTEHRPITSTDGARELPRLDAWYFRGAEPFRGWGTAPFRQALARRHLLRRVRRWWR